MLSARGMVSRLSTFRRLEQAWIGVNTDAICVNDLTSIQSVPVIVG